MSPDNFFIKGCTRLVRHSEPGLKSVEIACAIIILSRLIQHTRPSSNNRYHFLSRLLTPHRDQPRIDSRFHSDNSIQTISLQFYKTTMGRIIIAAQHLHSPGLHAQLPGRQYVGFGGIKRGYAPRAAVASACAAFDLINGDLDDLKEIEGIEKWGDVRIRWTWQLDRWSVMNTHGTHCIGLIRQTGRGVGLNFGNPQRSIYTPTGGVHIFGFGGGCFPKPEAFG